MKIVAIKQTSSGHNVHFISDEYSEYALDELLAQGNKIALENIQVFTPKSGKKSIRLKADKNKSNFGPLPEGNYIARFDKTIDYASAESLWDKVKWLIKKPSWGLIATPVEADSKTNTYGRSRFYIHGGKALGSKGCIDLANQNASFHSMLRLYHRNLRVVVKY